MRFSTAVLCSNASCGNLFPNARPIKTHISDITFLVLEFYEFSATLHGVTSHMIVLFETYNYVSHFTYFGAIMVFAVNKPSSNGLRSRPN
jgi:hypothetical protein